MPQIDLLSRRDNQIQAEHTALWGSSSRQVEQIQINDITPYTTSDGRPQPYRIQESKVTALLTSIEDIGVLQPLVVRKKGRKYQILAGHHRYYASVKAGLNSLPCEIKDVDDEAAYKIVAESNTRTEEVYPSENAEIFYEYMSKRKDSEDKTAKEIALKFNVSEKTIYRYIRLLDLIPELQHCVDMKIIPIGHFEKIVSGLTHEQQSILYQYIERFEVKKLNSAQIRDIIEYATFVGEAMTVDGLYEALNKEPEETEAEAEPVAETEPAIYHRIKSTFRNCAAMTNAEIDEYILNLLAEQFSTQQ